MPELGIIIINYESKADTFECLISVEKYAGILQPKVILIENSEIEKILPEELQTFQLDITFHTNKTNIGFAAAVNQGLKLLKNESCSYYLLLNNDVILTDDSLCRMLGSLKTHAEIGILGGVNYAYHQPNELWQAGFKNRWWIGGIKPLNPDNNPITEVDYVPGSAFMGRIAEAFEVGLLDENYFLYFEENDLCQKIKKQGKHIAYQCDTCFLHRVENRDRKDSPQMFYYLTRNEIYFLAHQNAWYRNFLAIPITHLRNGLRSLKYSLLTPHKNHRKLFLRAWMKASWHIVTHRMNQYNL